ncbi:MAG: flagellar hook assembly protein FlgD [Natronohydrobacter sp.]|nr:flagellar hook assembly protein FlgD [Natronohydrobacter sp.]
MLQGIGQGTPTAMTQSGPGRGGPSAISSDFQTFLRMLTVQMQNQNPLEPIEASDFAVQLATFSSVEQQVRTNDLLSQLSARMGLSELGSWVGRTALTSGPVFVGDAPQRLVPPEVAGADRAELIVSDLYGRELARFEVDPLATEINFDMPPVEDGGLVSGHYQMSMESYRAGTSLGVNPVLGYARVEEARMDAGQILLVLEGGHIINSNSVIGLRA